MNALEEYFGGIVEGRIVACEKMKLVAAKVLYDYHNPGQYHFSQEMADRHTSFIEDFCYVPAGRRNVRFKFELFQKAIMEVVFGFVDDMDLRRFQEVLLIMGRKNGKTTLGSVVEIDVTANDDEFAPETYNVATKLDQSKKGFDNCLKMIHQSPPLRVHFRKRVADLYYEPNMGTIKALASNTSTMDSLDVHCGIVDELGAITNRDLYDLIKQGMAARSQPLLFCISTNGYVRENIFDDQYRYASDWLYDRLPEPAERFIAFIYELDDRDEWDKEECWIKANPGLGTIKSMDFLRESVKKAKADPSYRSTVLVKDFNLRETTASAWLTWSDIETVEPDPDKEPTPDVPHPMRPVRFESPQMGFRYGIGGMDAADSIDLNAATALCQRRFPEGHERAGEIDPRIYLRSMYWLPETVLEERAGRGLRTERDNVPYLLWEQQGLLRTYPGNKVNKIVFLDWFRELKHEDDLYIMAIGYDPWHIDDSLLAEFEAEFGKDSMVKVRQGPQTMSGPLKELKADLGANRVVHNGHPIDMWCMSNAEIKTDINGNIQLVKGMHTYRRIDGVVALACGYIAWSARRDDYHALI